MPHQVAGGEESVSAVQHACFATGPAGRRHGHRWAHTAAPPGDRERGVAGEDPHPAPPRPAPPRPLFFCSTLQSQAPICRRLTCAGTGWLILWTGNRKKRMHRYSQQQQQQQQTMHSYLSVPHIVSQEKDDQI